MNRAAPAAFNGWAPIHVIVHAVSGNSVAVEYVNGDLQLIDNPTGVMTHSPDLQ